MSIDYHMMCQIKKENSNNYEGLYINGELWESKYWGCRAVKRALFRVDNLHINDFDLAKDIYELYDYCQFLKIENFSLDLNYQNSKDLKIISDFINEISDIMELLEEMKVKYEFVFRWC